MHNTRVGEGDRFGGTFREWVGLTVVVLLALPFAFTLPATNEAPSWREKDWGLWYQAHQLYQRDPEELSRAQFENVQRWCQCLALSGRHAVSGNQSLTAEECRFVVDVLGDLCPDLWEHAGYFPIYEACLHRLESEERVVAMSSRRDCHSWTGRRLIE